MTIANIGGRFQWPTPMAWTAALPIFGATTLLMDASGEKAALVFHAPKAGTLDKFEFRLGTLTNTTNGVRCSFQSVTNASVPRVPDETQDQFRAVTGLAANTWTVPGLMTSDGTDGGVKRTVTFGELLACVIDFESFTAGDVVAPNVSTVTNAATPHQHAYSISSIAKQAGAWVLSNSGNLVMALKYSDGSYSHVAHDVVPWSAVGTHTFNSGSTPDEIGIIWTPPAQVRAWGFHLRGDMDNAYDVVLYDTDGTTALETISIGANDRSVASSGGGTEYPFSQQRTLAAGSAYRLTVKPGASNVALYYADVSAAEIMDGAQAGSALHQTHRTNAGAWTQTTTRRPFMGFVLDGFSDGAGGGGGPLIGPGRLVRN